MMTSQFTCTRADIADGRVYWLHTAASRGSTVIVRLRQAVVTAGPAEAPAGEPAARRGARHGLASAPGVNKQGR